VLAAAPCPCARAASRAACTCTPAARQRYLARLAGPVLDRVDLKIELTPPSADRLPSAPAAAEHSSVVAARVAAARQRAATRLAGTPWRLNAEVPGSQLRRRFPPAAGGMAPLEHAMELGEISGRGMARILGVAWTLADLAGKPRPEAEETGTALSLRLGRPA
jgi:magnesium chelatase family protein